MGGQYIALGGRNMTLKKGLIFWVFLKTVLHNAHCAPWKDYAADISLRYYTGRTLNNGIDIRLNKVEELLFSIDNSKPTVFYIHGYTEDLTSNSVVTVVNAYLQRQDHNVIAVDWSEIANKNYVIVALSASIVGVELAEALNKLVNAGLDKNRLHIVGHSMGGQVAGYVGRNVNFQLPRITGLDAAGPGFHYVMDELSASDAAFVDLIFTDAGIYGFPIPTGSVNFFPNGGIRVQPGCPTFAEFFSDEDFCSHHRSWRFYAESLLTENAFLSVRCNSNLKFKNGFCQHNDVIPMGFAVPINSQGIFFLRTNSESPFGLGQQGATPA